MPDDDGPRHLIRGEGSVSLQKHWEAIDFAHEKFLAERDRRYSEVNIEREKALKIKEESDKTALGLAREIQSYKDEKANQLREQISGERGSYATKDDLAAAVREIGAVISPLSAFVQSSSGAKQQASSSITLIMALIAVFNFILVGAGALITFVSLRGH